MLSFDLSRRPGPVLVVTYSTYVKRMSAWMYDLSIATPAESARILYEAWAVGTPTKASHGIHAIGRVEPELR